jgi:hypothetical protein
VLSKRLLEAQLDLDLVLKEDLYPLQKMKYIFFQNF